MPAAHGWEVDVEGALLRPFLEHPRDLRLSSELVLNWILAGAAKLRNLAEGYAGLDNERLIFLPYSRRKPGTRKPLTPFS